MVVTSHMSTIEEGIRNVAMAQLNNSQAQQARRKGIGAKTWMVVSETGQSRVEEVDKHSIMRRTGLPARDLRVLDPMLSHPSSILGRERAIVINLEHIKAIITAKEALMVNSSNPLFLAFLQDLRSRLPSYTNKSLHQRGSNGNEADCEGKPLLGGSPSSQRPSDPENSASMRIFEDSPNAFSGTSNIEDAAAQQAPKQLPFEFRALEACLESACRCLDTETQTLENEAYPALDELTSQISTLNLERVRQIKSRLVELSGRVQKVRDQLEHLLDDDNDMAEMYLTQKFAARLLDRASLREGYNATICEDDDQRDESCSEKSVNTSAPKLDVEELEMLLEAYFAHINGILQKLCSLSEYVDDTEDYINIMLDDKRNQLLQAAVIFGTMNMILNAGIVVVGLFGMNIQIELFNGEPKQFWAASGGTLGGCVLLFILSVWWGKKRYLFSS